MIYFEDTIQCEICGKSYPRSCMETIFTGRTHYICWKCMRDAQAKVDQNKALQCLKMQKVLGNG